ncbi:methyltransferase type 11 [Achlya hypogyna]|uniref:Methyltransferase type 11 n=1 Tax=Achlya hypogyna TaxID=1202772 RepID=A0A1V9ZJF9_ACHHY|nr:methyltransferase type 11 [Achlya hypogyna]
MNVQAAYTEWATIYDTNKNRTRDLEIAVGQSILADKLFAHILELGCGTGKNSVWLAPKCQRLTSVDLTESMLDVARTKVSAPHAKFVQADLLEPKWTFATGLVDLVTFSLVLEHIPELAPIFANVDALLAPGGYVYIGELHPFKQYAGTKACFKTDSGAEQIVTCFTHHTSDFVGAAKAVGWQLETMDEFFDDNDRTQIPRILGLLFRKAQA